MSYILDALKKAELERQREERPDARRLLLPHGGQSSGQRRYWLPVVLVLGLNSALVGYLLLERTAAPLFPGPEAAGPTAADAQPAPQRLPPAQATEPSQTAATPPQATPEAVDPPTEPLATTVPASPPPATTVPPPPSQAPSHLETRSVPITLAPYRPASEDPAAASAPRDDAIPLRQQLPQALRDQLPALALAALVYSKQPADRMVFVNARLMHEGEAVDKDLELMEIRPDEVLFRFRETRFRIPMF